MRACPWCAEQLPDEFLQSCPHCGSRLEPDAPQVSPTGTAGSGGWAAMPPGPPTPATGGAGPAPGVASEPVPSGAPPTYTHSGYRYVLGYDAASYGIWDRQSPGMPLQRFPRSDDGWREAWTAYSRMEPQGVPAAAPGTPPTTDPAAPAFGQSKTNGMAVASLITAILFIPVVPIVLGHISKREIERSQGAQEGRGMAIAGLVMGWVTVGLILFALALAALFFATFGDNIVDLVEQDADARALMQNALVEVQDYSREHGSLEGLSPDKLEPSAIEWNTLAYPNDGSVSIRDVSRDRVLLVTRTNLGVDYCAAILANRTSYGTTNPATAEACSGGWVFQWQPPR